MRGRLIVLHVAGQLAAFALAQVALGADTALSRAARAGDSAAVAAALAETADVDAPDDDGTPALHWLVHHNEGQYSHHRSIQSQQIQH